MKCRLGIRKAVFNDSHYPPEIKVDIEIGNPVKEFTGILSFKVIFQRHEEYELDYLQDIHVIQGTTHYAPSLIIEPELLELINAHLDKENEGNQTVFVQVILFHRLSNNSMADNKAEIDISKKVLNSSVIKGDKKPSNVGLKHHPMFNLHLAESVSRLEERFTTSFDAKIMMGFIEYMKQVLLNDESLKDVAKLQGLINYSRDAKLTVNWISAAVLLALQEIRIRQALKKYCPQLDSENQRFEFLVKEFRKLLLDNNIPIDERKLSRIKGEHDYRNKVIHEGLQPEDGDIIEIAKINSEIHFMITTLEEQRK